MIEIVPFDALKRRQATALVDRVFPSQSPIERLGLRLFQTRWQWLLRLCGIVDARFWLASERETVLGIVGLYEHRSNRHEALWLGWFAVAPEARGKGVGGRLLRHAINEARASGRRSLRLYTSTDPNEEAAQAVYERHGFRITSVTQPLTWVPFGVKKIIREALYPNQQAER